MGYASKVQDKKLKDIVQKTYQTLHGCIQKKMEEKEAERVKEGWRAYQFLQPKWMPNSIHI